MPKLINVLVGAFACWLVLFITVAYLEYKDWKARRK